MTREDYINNLQSIIDDAEDMGLYDEDVESLQVAIEALEQEPKILNVLDFAIDASDGDTNYFVGFRNGLRYAKSLIDEEEPQFESCAEQEPKTGHWIYDNYNWRCSECNETPKTMGYVGTADFMAEHFKFCNHCGADMRGVKKARDKE